MNDLEIRQYLANIMSVAYLDSRISSKGQDALEELKIHLKVSKRDMEQAKDLASSPSFQIRSVGRYSDKLRNIEDMLFVAMSDGTLSDSEKVLIRTFAKEIGLTQDQVNAVVQETKIRTQTLRETAICSSCWKKIPSAVKFCPECGGEVLVQVEDVSTRTDFEYPKTGISIEFADSSAANFHEALQAAHNARNFQEIERRKKKWYLASWPTDQIAETLGLVNALNRLKNRKVHIDGSMRAWDDVFGFHWCYQSRNEAYRQAAYCFGVNDRGRNLWGCREARMDWHGWQTSWLSYGSFLGKDQFIFDKKRMRYELEKNLYKVKFCPAARFDFIETAFGLLPEKVRIGPAHGWDYNRRYHECAGGILLTQNVKEKGYEYSTQFYADGVRPIGSLVARQILTEALQRCRMGNVSLQDLIEREQT